MNINITALSRATVGTLTSVTFITIIAELSKPFKTILTNLSGHHWVSKGIISISLFVLLYLLLSKVLTDKADVQKETKYVIVTTILAGLALGLFFVWHFLTEA
ncbi:hypothetical protein HZB03_03565 [Candidatus Woesearchaeota archaeon]|nr:hypothetical protein [Candidatus Woesearchaeota archaeon]